MCCVAGCPLVLPCAGEKLSESRAADVRELCNTLLSAYLIQLLDTGLLHADPHPGNLIRTGAAHVHCTAGAGGGACYGFRQPSRVKALHSRIT